MVFGQNGIFKKAREAKEKMAIEEYREELQIISQELQIRKHTEQLTTRNLMDLYEQRIKESKKFQKEGTKIFWIDEQKTIIRVITPEYYVFDVTMEGLEFKGKQDKAEIPNIEYSDIGFYVSPTEFTNKEVKLEMAILKEELKNYKLQYSLDEINWIDYTEEITIEKNGAVYARVVNVFNESGTSAKKEIDNIDKLAPNKFVPTITNTADTITVTGTTTDKEKTTENACSGIEKYYFSIETTENGEDIWLPENGKENGTYTFENLKQKVEYSIKMKVVDNAGNETITDAVIATTKREPTAYLYSDGTLEFCPTATPDTSKTVQYTYTGWADEYCGKESSPWYNQSTSIKKVVIKKGALPEDTGSWFHGNSDSLTASLYRNLTTVIIEEDSLKRIGDGMFYQATGLSSISIPETVDAIGYAAFERCFSLKSIKLPSELDEIGSYVFKRCTALTTVEMPKKCPTVGNGAFYLCSTLTSLKFPEGITTISSYMFRTCEKLVSVVIPSTVTSIETNAFYNCKGLKNVYFKGTSEQWNAITVGTENTYLTNATNKVFNYSE